MIVRYSPSNFRAKHQSNRPQIRKINTTSNISYKANTDNDSIIVCVIAKNEDEYLEEWIKWYLDLGFDKIVIFDDNEDKTILPSITFISECVKNNKVEIIYCGNLKVSGFQVTIYKKFYDSNKFKWCAFFDADEFLVLKKHKNIKEYLSDPMFKDKEAISICWQFYGDNGHLTKTEGSVMERFPNPSDIQKTVNGRILVKKIIRSGIPNINFPNPHAFSASRLVKCCDNAGKTVKSIEYNLPPSYEYAKINHYWTKSTEEFVEKIKRGKISQKNGSKRKLNEYFDINPKTKDREEALNRYFNEKKNDIVPIKEKHNFKYDSKRKVLFLVMSCNLKEYINEEYILKETWANDIINGNITNASLITYRGSKNKTTYFDKDENILYVNAKDDWGGTYEKTIKAFEWINNNIEYDYIVRTNTSNYINLQSILKLINSLPDDDEYIYGTRIIVNSSSRNVPYFRGNCLILKKSIVNDIIKAYDKNVRTTDDSWIGYTLAKYYHNDVYFSKLRQFPTEYLYDKKFNLKYDYNKYKNYIDYRVKTSNRSIVSRNFIPEKMYKLDEIIKTEEREFIAPTEFNKDGVETLRGILSYENVKNDFLKKRVYKSVVNVPKINNPLGYIV